MRVKGLDGKEHTWNLTKYYNKTSSNASQPHIRARNLLKDIFPLEHRLEEVHLPGSNGLYADFYLPGLRLMVEVNGSQHYSFNSFHYTDKSAFYKAKARDRKKAEWCELNQIELLVLDDKDSDDEWRQTIKDR